MKGVIIIDGPDCSGKTTLAQYFMKRYSNVEYIHHGYKPEYDLYAMYMDALGRAAAQPEKLFLIDRLWMSELCYGFAYRGGPSLTEDQVHEIVKKANTLKSLYVYCLPDPIPHLFRFEQLRKQREEMFTDIRPVATEFRLLYQVCKNQSNLVTYDFINETLSSVIHKVTSYMKDNYGIS